MAKVTSTTKSTTVTLSEPVLTLIEQTREVNESPQDYVERAVHREALVRMNVLHTVTVERPQQSVTHVISSIIDRTSEACEVCGAQSGEESCIATGEEQRGDCPYWERITPRE